MEQEKPLNLREQRKEKEEQKARERINKYNTGKNKGRAGEAIRNARNLARNATPWGMTSLLFQIKPLSDWMYGLALIAAIFKDILDITEATGIMYAVVIVATLLCSIFIAMMMILGGFSNGAEGGRVQQKMIRSWLILLGGTVAEMLFGINFLPIETFTVAIVYVLLLSARKQSKRTPETEDEFTDGAADDYYGEDEYAQAA